MSAPLSSTAKAVLDAARYLPISDSQFANGETHRLKLAAAIHTLVEKVLPEETNPREENMWVSPRQWCEYAQRQRLRQEFLTISHELAGETS